MRTRIRRHSTPHRLPILAFLTTVMLVMGCLSPREAFADTFTLGGHSGVWDPLSSPVSPNVYLRPGGTLSDSEGIRKIDYSETQYTFDLTNTDTVTLWYSNVGTDSNNNPISCKIVATRGNLINHWNAGTSPDPYLETYGTAHLLVAPNAWGTAMWWFGGLDYVKFDFTFYQSATINRNSEPNKMTPVRLLMTADNLVMDGGGYEWIGFGSGFRAERYVKVSDSRIGTWSSTGGPSGVPRWGSDSESSIASITSVTAPADSSTGTVTAYVGDTVGWIGWTFSMEAPSWHLDVNATVDGVSQGTTSGGGTLTTRDVPNATASTNTSTDWNGTAPAKTQYTFVAQANEGKHLTSPATVTNRLLYNTTVVFDFVTNKMGLSYHTNTLPPTYKGQSGSTPIKITSTGANVTGDTVIRTDSVRYDNGTYTALVPSQQVSATGWHLQGHWSDANKSHNLNGGTQGGTTIASSLGLLDSFKQNDISANVYAQWLINHGGFKLQKVDADTGLTTPQGNASLAGATYNIINRGPSAVSVDGSSHATNTTAATMSTVANGTAATSSSLLPSSTYEIRESEASTGYVKNTSWGGEANIVTDGGIVDLSSSFGNCAESVVRGGVKVKKVDADDGSVVPQGNAGTGEGAARNFAGTQYTIKNLSTNPVYVNPGNATLANPNTRTYANGQDCLIITTGTNGTATLNNNALPYGKYEIRETTSVNGYHTNNTWKQEFNITTNEETVDLTNTDKQNPDTVWRGSITVNKADTDTRISTPQGDVSNFSGTTYKIINKSSHHVYAYNGTEWAWANPESECATITTDINGVAQLPDKSLPYGTYQIYEHSPTTGYNNSNWTKTFTITQDGQRITYDQVETTNPLVQNYEPVIRGGVRIKKVDEDNGSITPQGNAGTGDGTAKSFAGTRYIIKNLSPHPVYVNPGSAGLVQAGQRLYVNGADCLFLIANDDGIATLPANSLPYGTYEIREDTPVTGYLNNEGWSQTFSIRNEGEIIDLTGDDKRNPDTVQRGTVIVNKIDDDSSTNVTQGDAHEDFSGTTYKIISKSYHHVYAYNGTEWAWADPDTECATITTDTNGVAQLPDKSLPYGTYRIYEDTPTTGYNNSNWTKTFTITQDGQRITYDQNTGDYALNREKVIRGGLQIWKVDADNNQATSQGEAGDGSTDNHNLSGAVYEIVNKSRASVYVRWPVNDNRWVEPETPCGELITDENGYVELPADALPYGKYHVYEKTPPQGYNNSGWNATFVIDEEGEIIKYDQDEGEFVKNKEPVQRGTVIVNKYDRDASLDPNTPDTEARVTQGDARRDTNSTKDFSGTTYTITNQSMHTVYVDGIAYEPGASLPLIVANTDGIATKGSLPVGTYDIEETTPVEGYLPTDARGGSAWKRTFSIEDEGQTVTFDATNLPASNARNADAIIRGGLRIQKVDLESGQLTTQGDAGTLGYGDVSFAGTTYTIWNMSSSYVYVQGRKAAPNTICATITTDANGVAELPNDALPYGTYKVTETEAIPGYANSGWSKTFRIRQDGVTIDYDTATDDHSNQDTSEVPDADRYRNYEPIIRGDVAVSKVDWDGDRRALPQGDAGNPDADYSFAGTTYWVYNRSRHAVRIYDDRRPEAASHANGLYENGEVCLVLQADANGIARTEGKTLPYGTYEIVEETPVAGYLNRDPRTAADPDWHPGAGTKKWSRTFEIRNDGQLVSFSDSTDGNGRLRNEEPVIRGGVEVHKVDADTGLPYGQGSDASGHHRTFEGTAYEITSLSRHRVKVYWSDGTQRWIEYGGTCGYIYADADGVARLDANALPYGTYKIREVTPPAGYRNSGWAKTFRILEDGQIIVFNDDVQGDHSNQDTSTTPDADRHKNYESVMRGTVSVSKVDADTKHPAPQGDAQFLNTKYEVINRSDAPVTITDPVTGTSQSYPSQAVCLTLYANADGIAEGPDDILPFGSYSIREAEPPVGYANSNWKADFEISESSPEASFTYLSNCNYENVIKAAAPITIQKRDATYHDNAPTGGATLEGAEFSVRNSSTNSVLVDGEEHAFGSVIMTVVTGPDGKGQIPGNVLPVGKYTVIETDAPTGYVRNGSWSCIIRVMPDGKISLEGVQDTVTCEDEVIRGDLRMRKIDVNTGAGIPGVVFRITSATTDESHIVVTGEDGWLDTSASHAAHSHQTNANDDTVSYERDAMAWVAHDASATSGVWFTGRKGATLAPNDTQGALPYDTYTIEEIRCPANRDYELADPFDVSVTAGGVSDGGVPVIDNSPQAAIPAPPQNGDAVTVYKEAEPVANSKVEPTQRVRYTLTARNTGAAPRAYTLVRDYIPEGAQYIENSASDHGAYVPATDANNMTRRNYVEWLVRDIAPGEEKQVTFDVAIRYSVGQHVRNTAYFGKTAATTIAGAPTNPQPSHASNTVTHRAGEYPTPASVQIEKTSDPAPGTQVAYGSTIEYTLHVENKGGSASGITGVYDLIPEGTTLADNPTGTLTPDEKGIGWLVPALEPGASVTLRFTVAVTAREMAEGAAVISNQASWGDLSGSVAPTTPTNFMDNTTNVVEHPLYQAPSEKGMLHKTSDPLPETRVHKDDTIEYTLTAKNETTETWNHLLVRDIIPEGTAYVADSASEGAAFVGEEGSTDATSYVEWVLTDIKPGEECEMKFSVKVVDEWVSYVRNSASYESFLNDVTAGSPDNPQPRESSNEVKHPVKAQPGAEPFPLVHIEKSADPSPLTMVDVGREITYYLSVRNDGDSSAYDVRVYDPMPKGMTWVRTLDAQDEGVHTMASPEGVGWTIEELPVGKDVTLGFVGKVMSKETPEYAGISPVVRNRAFWSYENVNPGSWSNPPSSYEGMGNTSNAIEHPLVPLDQRQTGSAVTAYEYSNPEQNSVVQEGQEIEFDILLRHTGLVRQAATIVRNPIPAGTEYVDGSIDADGMYVDATRSPSGSAYAEWVVRDMDPDEVRHVHFRVRVTEGWRTYITSVASFGICADDAIAGLPANPVPSDRTNTIWFTTVESQPTPAVVQIEQRATPPTGSRVARGDTVRYELEVKNTGGSEAVSTGVYDALRDGAVVAENSVSTEFSGAAVNDARAVAWNIPSLMPGQSVSLSFSVVLEDALVAGSELRNQCSWGQVASGSVPRELLPNTSNTVAHPVGTEPRPVVRKEIEGKARRSYAPGSEVVFVLSVKNEGDGALSDWTLHEVPDEGWTYLSDDRGGTRAPNGTVWWPVVLGPGETFETRVTMRLDAKADTNVRNRALLLSSDGARHEDAVTVRCATQQHLVQTGAGAWLAAGVIAAAGIVGHLVIRRRRKVA